MSPELAQTPLTDLFRDFFALIESQLSRKAGPVSNDSPPSAESTVEDAQRPLTEFLEKLDTHNDRSADALAIAEVRFALAVFADDRIARTPSTLQQPWLESTLESRVFQTNSGGTEVFRRIKKLLETGNPGDRELGGESSSTAWEHREA